MLNAIRNCFFPKVQGNEIPSSKKKKAKPQITQEQEQAIRSQLKMLGHLSSSSELATKAKKH